MHGKKKYTVIIFWFADTDRDFEPSADMLVHDFDDEHTLDDEEAMSNSDSTSNELDALQKVPYHL